MPDARHIIPCDCCGTCALLVIDKWDDDDLNDSEEWYAEFFTAGPWTYRLRHRAKAAFKLLRGKEHYINSIVVSPEEVRRLRAWLIAEM